MRTSLLSLLTFSVMISMGNAQERTYGRSMVVTPYGIVATSYVQASQAGARVLERGGSAIDAGIAALEMLNIMQQFPPDPKGPLSTAELHTRIEAMKLAYADLGFIADQRFSAVPVNGMLAKDYAKEPIAQEANMRLEVAALPPPGASAQPTKPAATAKKGKK